MRPSFVRFAGRASALPVFSVEVAIADRLGNVELGDHIASCEVGNGARDLQDAVVTSRGEAELLKGGAEDPFRLLVEDALGADLSG